MRVALMMSAIILARAIAPESIDLHRGAYFIISVFFAAMDTLEIWARVKGVTK